jgi:hypothetical protein
VGFVVWGLWCGVCYVGFVMWGLLCGVCGVGVDNVKQGQLQGGGVWVDVWGCSVGPRVCGFHAEARHWTASGRTALMSTTTSGDKLGCDDGLLPILNGLLCPLLSYCVDTQVCVCSSCSTQ